MYYQKQLHKLEGGMGGGIGGERGRESDSRTPVHHIIFYRLISSHMNNESRVSELQQEKFQCL